MMSDEVDNLRAAEAKLLAKLKPGERMLFDPEHERHPQGEDWWRKLSIFRGWLEQLKEVRRELADLGEEIQCCALCGSIAWFDGQLVGCHDCQPSGPAGEIESRLLSDGYAVISTCEGAVVVIRESDTPVPNDLAGATRYSVDELVRHIGVKLGEWQIAVGLRALFPGVDLAAGGPEPQGRQE